MECDFNFLYTLFKNIYYQLAELRAITPGIVKYSLVRLLDKYDIDVKVDDVQVFVNELFKKLCISVREIKIEEDMLTIYVNRSSCPFRPIKYSLEEEYCFIPFMIIESLRRNFDKEFYLYMDNKKFIFCNEEECYFKIKIYERKK